MKSFFNLLKTTISKISHWGAKNVINFIYFELIYFFRFNSRTLFGIQNNELDYEIKDDEEFIEYIPTPFFLINKSAKKINLNLTESCLVDFGSGAGRALEFFINKEVKFCKGIERSYKLTELARLNLSKYDNVELFHMDAENYKIDNKDNIFFLYDPFGIETIKKVIKNINYSVKISPREINIIYVSPRYNEIFKSAFKVIYEDVNKFNLGVVVFSN